MRIPYQVITVGLVFGAVTLAFTNCQQGIDFKSKDIGSSSPLGTGPGTPVPPPSTPDSTTPPPVVVDPPPVVVDPPPIVVVPPPPPTTPVEVKQTCDTMTKQNKVLSVVFPNPKVTCVWNKDGNLAPKNEYFQGRIEQTQNLDLPAGAKVCGAVFSFEKQPFLYDDHFIFAFDDSVLASSFNFSNQLSATSGLLHYDWSKIAGMYWDKSREGVYCASVTGTDGMVHSATCNWPQTDVAGTIEMNFPAEILYSVMAKDSARTTHDFKFIAIGDNDSLDCEHSDIRFNVMIEYVVPTVN